MKQEPIYFIAIPAFLVAVALLTVLFHVTGTPLVEVKDVAKVLAGVAVLLLARSQVTPSTAVGAAASGIVSQLEQGDVAGAKSAAGALAKRVDPKGKSVPPPPPAAA